MTVVVLRPEQLGKAMDDVSREAVPLLMREFHAGLHQALRAEVRRITPVKRSVGSRPAGVLKRSIGSVVGGRGGVVKSGMRARILKASPGTKSSVVIRAPHAIVISKPGIRGPGPRGEIIKRGKRKGQRRGKSRAGSPYGSSQAPRGIPEPALEALGPRAPKIFERAQRKAEVIVDGR